MATINLQTELVSAKVSVEKSYLTVHDTVPVGSAAFVARHNTRSGTTVLAATSSSDALAKAGAIWGTGYGDFGYGQTSPSLTYKGSTQRIKGSDWADIRTTIVNISGWQNSPTTGLIPSTELDAGDLVLATHPTNFRHILKMLEGNRLDYQVANMTLTTNAVTSTRATSWMDIFCSFTAEQATENQLRYFFNTGGEMRISFSHSNTSTQPNILWGTALNNLVVAFRANKTVQLSGAFTGSALNIGYYQLTESYQTIFDGSSMSAYAYSSGNTILIQARSTYIEGLNGAKGRVVQLKVILTDNTLSTIAAGTTVSISHLRATTTIVIPSLTCALNEAL